MKIVYTASIRVVGFVLKFLALFNKKLKLFVEGRKDVFFYLKEKIDANEQYIWFHTASLGEFEQGLPVMKELRKKNKIIVTFFSPSGYEIRKNSKDVDVVVYLPLDTPENARRFIEVVRPKTAIFVKYDFWYHYLSELKKNQIPTYLISGNFRENQIFFKSYGGMMRDCLRCFSHFFVQNEKSKLLLQSIGFENVMVSGDTRFDRVLEILDRDNSLDFIETFKNNSTCVVFGSSWEEDEEIYLSYVNNSTGHIKFIIAPHNINPEKIHFFKQKISKKIVFFSERQGKNLSDFDVFIIDTIGILTKVYSYADIAYVGGGMGKSGLHNVLEPAVFGIPVVIGKNYEKFNEAKALVGGGGVVSVTSEEEFKQIMDLLISIPEKQEEIGKVNKDFIIESQGATQAFITFYENRKNKEK